MKKLLIITSDPLNPNDLISSTFELSQAQLLKEVYDVAILSVHQQTPALTALKILLANAIKERLTLKMVINLSKTFFSEKLFPTVTTLKHNINGVKVYEIFYRTGLPSKTFLNSIGTWLVNGRYGFQVYIKKGDLPDIIHAHGRFLYAGVLAKEIHEQYGVKYIYTDHSSYYSRGMAAEQSKCLLDQVIQNASAFTTVSVFLNNEINKFLGKTYKALTLPNVLDDIFIAPVSTKKIISNEFTFAWVGTLDSNKRLDFFIQALGEINHPNFRAVICGDGPERERIEKQIDYYGLNDSIDIKGKVPKEKVREVLDYAHVVVSTSIIETFGVIIIEAFSRGCPVIATKSGGADNLLQSKNGILVESNNLEQFKTALINIYENYMAYDSEAIRKDALKRFGGDAFLEQFKKLEKIVLK